MNARPFETVRLVVCESSVCRTASFDDLDQELSSKSFRSLYPSLYSQTVKSNAQILVCGTTHACDINVLSKVLGHYRRAILNSVMLIR